MSERAYSTFEAARLCGVDPSTVIRWVNEKKLKAYITPGGHRRILESDLLVFLNKHKMPGAELLKRRGGPRVLIVEDDPSVGLLLRKALLREKPGLEVHWIRDGIEALIALGKNPPDLVVLDVYMPGLDGVKVLATLRADPATRRTKVIGITGKSLPPDKLRFMRSRADAFYKKPFDIHCFANRCLEYLGLAVPARRS